jgi:hypothetical protein
MRETRGQILDGASVALCRRDGRQFPHKHFPWSDKPGGVDRCAGRSCKSWGTVFIDPGATATDSIAGNLTSAIIVTGTVNMTRIVRCVIPISAPNRRWRLPHQLRI